MPAFTFDDVLLIPNITSVKKEDISLATDIGVAKLGIPIISAAMDTVTETRMQAEMYKWGGFGIHHRFNVSEEDLIYASTLGPVAVAPSMGKGFLDKLVDFNPNAIIKIDVANGGSMRALDYAWYARNLDLNVISGNLVTVEVAKAYIDRGVTTLSIGIGPGGACKTRTVTGFGYPQLSAIDDLDRYRLTEFLKDVKLIADGGMRTTGDILKAIAFGADAVILGSMLAGAYETPGDVSTDENGDRFKRFRGMASKSALEEAGKDVRPEGEEFRVPYRGYLKNILAEIVDNLKLGFGKYGGASTVEEFQLKVHHMNITEAAYREGLPRGA